MNKQKRKEKKSQPINLVLIGVSLIVFGSLGIIFITQMELQPGLGWYDIDGLYPSIINPLEIEDINGDAVPDILCYVDILYHEEEDSVDHNTPLYGSIFALDGLNGEVIWFKEYDSPIKRVFSIMDVDNDGHSDFFIDKASVEPEFDNSGSTIIIPNKFTNQLISGIDGTEIPISTVDGINFTNSAIIDLVSFSDLTDEHEDIFCLEYKYFESWENYLCNITGYFINGTKKTDFFLGDYVPNVDDKSTIPGIELLSHFDSTNLLYIGLNSLHLFNLSLSNYMEEIYNVTFFENIIDYTFIEDLNLDGIREISAIIHSGEIFLIDGSNGNIIQSIDSSITLDQAYIKDIPSPIDDGTALFLLDTYHWVEEGLNEEKIRVYSLTTSSQEIIWSSDRQGEDSNIISFVLDDDFNGDSISEIVLYERIETSTGTGDVHRYRVFSVPDGNVLSTINLNNWPEYVISTHDIDGDGKKDFAIGDADTLLVISSKKPSGMWLSSTFGFGMPLFIVLLISLISGLLLLILNIRKIEIDTKKAKESKLTISVNAIVIALMTISFTLFLLILNIFNKTLILGEPMTELVIVYISVVIIWFGMLPFTAAIYNKFSPRFAYLFIKLRIIFFKISKSHNNEIIVLDMKGREDLGTINRIKRVLLPLLLSITVGFYTYNTLAPLLEYPQSFTNFGSNDFFGFIIGYNVCCMLPMVLSFLMFSFLFSGNFLLDDAGIAYYLESKKHRKPGDIEPISIWALSFVKGMAGLSAIITFWSFFSLVDFSGFFRGEISFIIFGTFLVIVMFWGAPFFSAFAYMLLAIEIMNYSKDVNSERLYNIMKKNNLDTTPRDLINIYPAGYKPPKKDLPDSSE